MREKASAKGGEGDLATLARHFPIQAKALESRNPLHSIPVQSWRSAVSHAGSGPGSGSALAPVRHADAVHQLRLHPGHRHSPGPRQPVPAQLSLQPRPHRGLVRQSGPGSRSRRFHSHRLSPAQHRRRGRTGESFDAMDARHGWRGRVHVASSTLLAPLPPTPCRCSCLWKCTCWLRTCDARFAPSG